MKSPAEASEWDLFASIIITPCMILRFTCNMGEITGCVDD